MKTFTTLALFGVATAIKLRSDDGGDDWKAEAKQHFQDAQEWAKMANEDESGKMWEGAWDEAVKVWDGVDTSDDGHIQKDEVTDAAAEHGLPECACLFMMDMMDTNDDGTVSADEGKAAAMWVKENLATITWEQVEEAWTAHQEGWTGPKDGETTAAQEGEGDDWESKAEEWFRMAQDWATTATDEDWAGAWDDAVKVWDNVDTSDNGKIEIGEATGAATAAGLPAEAAEFMHQMMDTNDDGTVDGEEGKAAAMWLKENLATITWEEVRTHWGAWKLGWKGPGSESEGEREKPTKEEVKDWVKGAHTHLKGMIEEGEANGMTTDDMAKWVMDHVDTDDSGKICLGEGAAMGAHFGLSEDDVAIIGELMDTDGSQDISEDEVAQAIEEVRSATDGDLEAFAEHLYTA